MSTTSKASEKLSDPEYRRAFVSSQINVGIPFQLRAMMKTRGWTQGDLAKRSDMLQPRISGLLTPGRTRPNIDTLRRLAEAFDCALMVRFVPFSELVKWSEDFDPEIFVVPEFEHDTGFVERKQPTLAGMSTANVGVLSMAAGGRTAGRSLEEIGNTPAVQSSLQHSSAGITRAEPMQQTQAIAIPSGIQSSSSSAFDFSGRAQVVPINHRKPKEESKKSRRKPFSRRRGIVYA